MKVFISSTVYDLLDVRAELACELAALGISPVLSDDKLSDFKVDCNVNSIETCLVNVDACDAVILILDRRYGPKLGQFGFEDVSATHLEYRRAAASNKPVHFFVRDRLLADHTIWKRNKKKDEIELAWVESKNHGLFDLLDEHMPLVSKKNGSNWIHTFTSSVDLNTAVRKTFGAIVLPERVVSAIQHNEFPIIDVSVKVEYVASGSRGSPYLSIATDVVNVGGGPAFNVRVHLDSEESAKIPEMVVMPTGKRFPMCSQYPLLTGSECNLTLVVSYESAIGVSVSDRFKIHGAKYGNALSSGGILESRSYRRCSEVTVVIE